MKMEWLQEMTHHTTHQVPNVSNLTLILIIHNSYAAKTKACSQSPSKTMKSLVSLFVSNYTRTDLSELDQKINMNNKTRI
jgi:hypothetical protein